MSNSQLKFDQHAQRLLRARAVRLRKYLIPMLTVGAIILFTGFYLKDIVAKVDDISFIKWGVPILVMSIITGYLSLQYLEGYKSKYSGKQRDDSMWLLRDEMKYMMSEIHLSQASVSKENIELFNILKVQIEKHGDFRWNKAQQEQLFSSIRQSFIDNVDEGFFQNLNEQLALELTKEKKSRLEMIGREFLSIKSRLINEIDILNRKANLNLVIGSMSTTIALVGLGYVVFQNGSQFNSYAELIYHYLPRISFVVFIEVFAYFFLRLYKLNLEDTKYFQNELTNVELKLVATSTAISFGKDVDITSVINELSRTERNFVLKKGETTVELEKSKIERSDLKQIINTLPEFGKKKK